MISSPNLSMVSIPLLPQKILISTSACASAKRSWRNAVTSSVCERPSVTSSDTASPAAANA